MSDVELEKRHLAMIIAIHNAMVSISDNKVDEAYVTLRDIMRDEYVAIGSPYVEKPIKGTTKESNYV